MTRPVEPLTVLIVEDEALLAMDLEAMVEDAGHRVVAEAASLPDVVGLAPDLHPAIAFVDVQLARQTNGIDVAHFILGRWPATVIIFVTANLLKLPPDFAGAHGAIAKPFSRAGLISAMGFIAEAVTDPPPVSPQPPGFIAAPAYAASWTTLLPS